MKNDKKCLSKVIAKLVIILQNIQQIQLVMLGLVSLNYSDGYYHEILDSIYGYSLHNYNIYINELGE